LYSPSFARAELSTVAENLKPSFVETVVEVDLRPVYRPEVVLDDRPEYQVGGASSGAPI